MRPTGTPEELERRRLRALTLLGQGMLPGEVAKHVGVDRRSVRRWKATIREDGENGLRARPAPLRLARRGGPSLRSRSGAERGSSSAAEPAILPS